MILQSARLTLKQHRFEVGAAAIAGLLLGAAALCVNARLLGVNVPADCFEAWIAAAGEVGPECGDRVRRFSEINGDEAAKVFAAMAVLPFLAGLLAGVVLVGRELEARTAQTAWALAASRRRWLARQLLPVVLVLGLSVTFAALAASNLETTRAAFYSGPLTDLGLYGPLVVARAFASLGVGLISGSVLGRTLPALIVGSVLSLALLLGAGVTREVWLSAQPQSVFEQVTVQSPGFDGLPRQQGWRAPDGTILTESEATRLAPTDGSTDPYQWLVDRGYQVVQLGIPGDTARGWGLLETTGFILVGLLLLAGTMVIVDHRRPT